MILERFDRVIFVGDGDLSNVYAAFNMLLRGDMALGSLKQWEMTHEQAEFCKCDKQYLSRDCARYLIRSSEDVYEQDSKGGNWDSYSCSAR